MPEVGNANLIELVRLGFAALTIWIHVALVLEYRSDVVLLVASGAENGRVTQARSDITSQAILLAVQVVIAITLLDTAIRVPTYPSALTFDLVFVGVGFLLVQALLTYLAIHKYRTRAIILGKLVRWLPRVRGKR